jgi:hypothetical protein
MPEEGGGAVTQSSFAEEKPPISTSDMTLQSWMEVGLRKLWSS